MSYADQGANQAFGPPRPGSSPVLATTLLSLVQALLHQGLSEQDVVRRVLDDVGSGRVVLTGNFRGCRLDPRDQSAGTHATSSRSHAASRTF